MAVPSPLTRPLVLRALAPDLAGSQRIGASKNP